MRTAFRAELASITDDPVALVELDYCLAQRLGLTLGPVELHHDQVELLLAELAGF